MGFRSGHSGGGIQCVTFARADTGIELSGNASTWWEHAIGLYQRGNQPEAGSILNFRANGAMRMGHVAVVNHLIDSRTLIVDHANWGGPGAVRGGVSRSIPVVDVSPRNDWTAVRVGLGQSGEYGSIYPTFGFIYNRPDAGVMVAAVTTGASVPAMNPAPRDLRGRDAEVEVAEAPEGEARSYAYRGSGKGFGVRVSNLSRHDRKLRFGSRLSGHNLPPIHTAAFNPGHGQPTMHTQMVKAERPRGHAVRVHEVSASSRYGALRLAPHTAPHAPGRHHT